MGVVSVIVISTLFPFLSLYILVVMYIPFHLQGNRPRKKKEGKKKRKLTSCRDVAAGIAILKEAGGLVTTATPPSDPETADIQDARLGSRLYLGIR